MKVLIIEDNGQNLYLEQFLLEAKGHRVESAVDGTSGIALAQKDGFDIILLDIQLPDMDGHEVARRITALPDWKAIPIVAVTSFAMTGDREKALAAGCSGYLEKPIDPDRFATQVENMVKQAGDGDG